MDKEVEHAAAGLKAAFDDVLEALRVACESHYGARLVSLVVFGSVGRGTMRPDSDIDVLVVADPLPDGRMSRVRDFAPVEEALEPMLQAKRPMELATSLSPIFKTPGEMAAGSPLLLDMTEDARVLYDRDCFFQRQITEFGARLKRLGARRFFVGNAWWWDLKPDFRPGDTVTL